jgi:probable H4MPT-linked C1 transfer pathway protein
MSVAVLGLDVGGANLKAAWYSPDGQLLPHPARSRPFALWKKPAGLVRELLGLTLAYPRPDLLAVTMTGELCDCFASKREGVRAILDAVEQATPSGVPVTIWSTQGRFVDAAAARAHPLPVASANWLALATFAARFAERDGTALLIDVGSTTTDIIPLAEGRPVPQGRLDPDRLRSGELVYTGVRRTPVCALVQEGVAAEVFATTLDAYLHMLLAPGDPRDCNTADGRPATPAAADLRLARMLGADLETSSFQERKQLANEVITRQQRLVAAALGRVWQRLPAAPKTVILAGEGEVLARLALLEHAPLQGGQSHTYRTVSMRETLGEERSKAACAHAVAVLAAELAAGGPA